MHYLLVLVLLWENWPYMRRCKYISLILFFKPTTQKTVRNILVDRAALEKTSLISYSCNRWLARCVFTRFVAIRHVNPFQAVASFFCCLTTSVLFTQYRIFAASFLLTCNVFDAFRA